MATLTSVLWALSFVTESGVDLLQSQATVASHLPGLEATSALGAALGVRVERPVIGVHLGLLHQILRHAVFVFDSHVHVLRQEDHIDSLGRGAQAGEMVRGSESLWLPLVVPDSSGKLLGTWEINAPVAVQIVRAQQIADGQVIVRRRDFADDDVRGTGRDQQNIVVADLQRAHVQSSVDGAARRAIALTATALVFLRVGAQHHVTTDLFARSVDAHVQVLLVTTRSVNDTGPVAVVESLSLGHAVQLARIRSLPVGNPLVEDILKFHGVELGALLLPEVNIPLGTVLK